MIRYQGAYGQYYRQLVYVRFAAAQQQYCAPELRGQSIDGLALIDTGAGQSAIAHDAASKLGLVSRTTQPVSGVTGEADCFVYSLRITLQSNGRYAGEERSWMSVKVFEAKFDSMPDATGLPVIGLIGRDMLSSLKVTFDGPNQSFVIDG